MSVMFITVSVTGIWFSLWLRLDKSLIPNNQSLITVVTHAQLLIIIVPDAQSLIKTNLCKAEC